MVTGTYARGFSQFFSTQTTPTRRYTSRSRNRARTNSLARRVRAPRPIGKCYSTSAAASRPSQSTLTRLAKTKDQDWLAIAVLRAALSGVNLWTCSPWGRSHTTRQTSRNSFMMLLQFNPMKHHLSEWRRKAQFYFQKLFLFFIYKLLIY